jgi:hypothetical protein
MTLWGVIVAGTGGAMFGNFFWYLLARVIGIERFRPFIEKHGRWLTLDWPMSRNRRSCSAAMAAGGRRRPHVADGALGGVDPGGAAPHAAEGFLLWSTIGTAGWSSAWPSPDTCSASSSRTSRRSWVRSRSR